MLALTDEPTSRRADAQMGGRGRPDPTGEQMTVAEIWRFSAVDLKKMTKTQ